MVNFLISYSNLGCLSVILFWSSIRWVSEIWFFIFSTYSAFEVKELLNFQKPFPQVGISFNCNEKNIDEWLVQKEARTSVFMIDSCSVLEIRKRIKPPFNETRNVVLPKCKTFTLRFLFLQISHKQRVPFISISFARYFFFNTEFPPDASNLQSKIKLKSPQKILFFCYKHQFFQVAFVEWRKYTTAQIVLES